MSLVLRFSLLRNNVRSGWPVRFLKQHAGCSSEKLLEPRSCGRQHFATIPTEAASWHKTDPPAIPALWLQHTSEHDLPSTVLAFDVETTGFFHRVHRIVELAVRDLSGGKNCTFETLINPERDVPGHVTKLTKITTELVCRPDVPRFRDVLPILLAYVRSRQAPGKPVLWVAHNATAFDVPFVAQEFDRCSVPIPSDWLYVDTLPLARKLRKIEESKLKKIQGEKQRSLKLEALGDHYGTSSEGPSHTAMPDVTVLCDILPKITLGLKLTCDDLLNDAMSFSDARKVS